MYLASRDLEIAPTGPHRSRPGDRSYEGWDIGAVRNRTYGGRNF